MTDLSNSESAGALLEGPERAEKPSESTIARVAKDYHVHPLRQAMDILLMRFGAQKLGANEYYDLKVFDPVHGWSAKREFLGQGGINALNMKINPDTLMDAKNFVGNKLAYAHHLEQNGIAVPRTQALVTTQATSDQDFVLKECKAVEAFLREKAEYPLFGKPLGGSLSVGSVRVERLDGDTLHLGKGGTVTVSQFAADVLSHYPDGYLLQTALAPHKDLSALTGDVIGSVRVVTTRNGSATAPAYAVWKLPSPNAMSDNFWQEGSMLSLIDLKTGIVSNCHRGKGLDAEFLEMHPTTGERIIGQQIPFWDALLETACEAHDLSPELGICGFDIAVTDQGPVILECNDKPNHMLYQFPARKGIMNKDLQPVWKAAIGR